jgi:hypothetical protein
MEGKDAIQHYLRQYIKSARTIPEFTYDQISNGDSDYNAQTYVAQMTTVSESPMIAPGEVPLELRSSFLGALENTAFIRTVRKRLFTNEGQFASPERVTQDPNFDYYTPDIHDPDIRYSPEGEKFYWPGFLVAQRLRKPRPTPSTEESRESLSKAA